MIETRESVEAFIKYIDWDKSPNGWGDGQLVKNAPESAKKAYAEYKKKDAERNRHLNIKPAKKK
ncbi:MAG: hypothetical protein IJI57_04370 [Flexilinea sp.]|nr:hypothetical protein [Flexilinea sp.]